MKSKGHIHAELMAQYAEDAREHEEPWKLWESMSRQGTWIECLASPRWVAAKEYRRKQKTHIVNGVEIPDLRIKEIPSTDTWMVCVNPVNKNLFHINKWTDCIDSNHYKRLLKLGLLYEDTSEGKRAAILHAKAMLGTVKGSHEQTARPLTVGELKAGGWWCADTSNEAMKALSSYGFTAGVDMPWSGAYDGRFSLEIGSDFIKLEPIKIFNNGLREIYRVGNEFYWV